MAIGSDISCRDDVFWLQGPGRGVAQLDLNTDSQTQKTSEHPDQKIKTNKNTTFRVRNDSTGLQAKQ